MKSHRYGVISDFFGGVSWGPYDEGSFSTFEEAKSKFDSIELDECHKGVFVYELHDDCCKELLSKEYKLKLPTPETMGRAKYIPLKECQRLSKEGKL